MKKRIVVWLIAAIVTVSPAWAENLDTPEETHWAVTAGTKFWYSAFDTTFVMQNIAQTIEFDSSYSVGPAIRFRYKNFFAGLSYLASIGDYQNDADGNADDDYPGLMPLPSYLYDTTVTANETDWDASIGYNINRGVALFLGYRNSQLECNYESHFFHSTDGQKDHAYLITMIDGSLTGPLIGITGNFPVRGTRYILFGTLSYASFDYSFKTTGSTLTYRDYQGTDILSADTSFDIEEKIGGPSAELGMLYALPKLPMSVSVSYKHQAYSGGDVEINFRGMNVGLSYSF